MNIEQLRFGRVSVALYKKMVEGVEGIEGQTEDMSGIIEGLQAEEDAPDQEKVEPTSIHPTPWENSEQDYALALALYTDKKARIVSLEGSTGLALACLRQQRPITVFVSTSLQKQVLFETVVCKICHEILSGRADGFLMRSRCLTRAASLTGTDTSRPLLPDPRNISAPETATEDADEDEDKDGLGDQDGHVESDNEETDSQGI